MGAILTRAGCFIALILMGYVLRRVGFFKQEDFQLLSKIVIRITLTAAIVTNFANGTLEWSMLILTVLGFGYGCFLMASAYLLNRRKTKPEQAFSVLNIAGCNLGNFVLPFAQSFLGPTGVMAVSLFDAGNSFICLGGAFGVASAVRESGQRFRITPVLRAMSRSVPLITYIIMTILSALKLRLPEPVVQFAGIIANANAFLAMLMIGVGVSVSIDPAQLRRIASILVPRFGIGIALAVLSFRMLPFPLEYRQALAIVFLAPISSAAPSFTLEMKGDYGLACAINSLSIVTSVVLIVTTLLIVL